MPEDKKPESLFNALKKLEGKTKIERKKEEQKYLKKLYETTKENFEQACTKEEIYVPFESVVEDIITTFPLSNYNQNGVDIRIKEIEGIEKLTFKGNPNLEKGDVIRFYLVLDCLVELNILSLELVTKGSFSSVKNPPKYLIKEREKIRDLKKEINDSGKLYVEVHENYKGVVKINETRTHYLITMRDIKKEEATGRLEKLVNGEVVSTYLINGSENYLSNLNPINIEPLNSDDIQKI